MKLKTVFATNVKYNAKSVLFQQTTVPFAVEITEIIHPYLFAHV